MSDGMAEGQGSTTSQSISFQSSSGGQSLFSSEGASAGNPAGYSPVTPTETVTSAALPPITTFFTAASALRRTPPPAYQAAPLRPSAPNYQESYLRSPPPGYQGTPPHQPSTSSIPPRPSAPNYQESDYLRSPPPGYQRTPPHQPSTSSIPPRTPPPGYQRTPPHQPSTSSIPPRPPAPSYYQQSQPPVYQTPPHQATIPPPPRPPFPLTGLLLPSQTIEAGASPRQPSVTSQRLASELPSFAASFNPERSSTPSQPERLEPPLIPDLPAANPLVADPLPAVNPLFADPRVDQLIHGISLLNQNVGSMNENVSRMATAFEAFTGTSNVSQMETSQAASGPNEVAGTSRGPAPRAPRIHRGLLRQCCKCHRWYDDLIRHGIRAILLRCTHSVCSPCFLQLYAGASRARCPYCDHDYHKRSRMILDHEADNS